MVGASQEVSTMAEETRVPYSFKLPPKLIEAAKVAAQKENRSFNNWVETVIHRAVEETKSESLKSS